MGVEEVRRTVQRHGGLARAGSTLDESTPAQGARMISSCSRWIVATMSPMWPVRASTESGEQGAGSAEGEAAVDEAFSRWPVEPRPSGRAGSPEASAKYSSSTPVTSWAADGEVTTPRRGPAVDAGGPVEGLGDRRPPVHHQRVRWSSPETARRPMWNASLATAPSSGVSSRCAEAQGLVANVQLVEAGRRGAAPRCRARCGTGRSPAPRDVSSIGCAVTHGVEPRRASCIERCSGTVEERLLVGDLPFRVPRHPPPALKLGSRSSLRPAPPHASARSRPVAGPARPRLWPCPTTSAPMPADATPTRLFCGPAGAAAWRTYRCGSCARRDVPCPSTGRLRGPGLDPRRPSASRSSPPS